MLFSKISAPSSAFLRHSWSAILVGPKPWSHWQGRTLSVRFGAWEKQIHEIFGETVIIVNECSNLEPDFGFFVSQFKVSMLLFATCNWMSQILILAAWMSWSGGRSKLLNPLEACVILRFLENLGWKDESKNISLMMMVIRGTSLWPRGLYSTTLIALLRMSNKKPIARLAALEVWASNGQVFQLTGCLLPRWMIPLSYYHTNMCFIAV